MESCSAWVSSSQTVPQRKFGLYGSLSQAARYAPVGEWLARIISSWISGDTVLPAYLGLGRPALAELMARHFPGLVLPDSCQRAHAPPDLHRAMEREAVQNLLLDNCSLSLPDAHWLARIMAEGCLGEDHLWQDLGLWSREDLSALIHHAFAPLANRNELDMKWKKFFYKQLCAADGVSLCRAPSCDVCRDYERCFGPEE
ncbi:MAG: nitrogen fixation protein NifQ [Magnetococcales bacterium]|nr:nitrogen fixation protein NifQ [Magnetococcales bacterium]